MTFSLQWSFWILCLVVGWKSTDVSVEYVLSVFRVEERYKQETSIKLMGTKALVSCLAYSSTSKMTHVPPKRQLTFNGLDGIISQKTELFCNCKLSCSFVLWNYSLSRRSRGLKFQLDVLFRVDRNTPKSDYQNHSKCKSRNTKFNWNPSSALSFGDEASGLTDWQREANYLISSSVRTQFRMMICCYLFLFLPCFWFFLSSVLQRASFRP
jgi:hypothetical protein